MFEKFAFSKNPPTALMLGDKEVDLPPLIDVQIASYETNGVIWVGVRCNDPEVLEAAANDICAALAGFGESFYATVQGSLGLPDLKVIAGTHLDADPTSLLYDLAYAPYYGIEQAEGRIDRETTLSKVFAEPYRVTEGPIIVGQNPNPMQFPKEGS